VAITRAVEHRRCVEREPFALCPVCRDRIGVYEPAVVLEDSGARLTSLASEPRLRASGVMLLHARCAAARGSEPELS
jgi:hypothetical protein